MFDRHLTESLVRCVRPALTGTVALLVAGLVCAGCSSDGPRRPEPPSRPPRTQIAGSASAGAGTSPAVTIAPAPGAAAAATACRAWAAAGGANANSVQASTARRSAAQTAQSAGQQDQRWGALSGAMGYLADLPLTDLSRTQIARAKTERVTVRQSCATVGVTVP